MAHVKYDGGAIVKAAWRPFPGSVEVADDHADYAAFKQRVIETDDERVDNVVSSDPVFRGLVRSIAKERGITEGQLLAEIKTEAGR